MRACSGCGHEIPIPFPREVQEQQDRSDAARDQARAEWKAKWGNHNHIVDPQPLEDFNGFFDAVRAFAFQHQLTMAEILKPAGIFGVPATEDYGRTLRALQLVPEEELRQLPPQLQEALLEVRRALEKVFR